MIDKLILAWRCPHTSEWIPVGELSYKSNKYFFEYTLGALKAQNDGHFIPFGQMVDLNKTYESNDLFPIFQNRLLQKSRPEYDDYIDWLDLNSTSLSPLNELARSGGIRATDNLQLFPIPRKRNNRYEIRFFSHGIRYLPPCYIDRINHLNPGNKLYLMMDVQNKYDPFALALRTGDPIEIVGYTPRFFSQDLGKLLGVNGPNNVCVSVEKVNLKSPIQFRLLCKLDTLWPNGFTPFKQELFNPTPKF